MRTVRSREAHWRAPIPFRPGPEGPGRSGVLGTAARKKNANIVYNKTFFHTMLAMRTPKPQQQGRDLTMHIS